VLGYLNPDYFADGTMPLWADRARQAVAEQVAGPLGLDVAAAAAGIHRVVNDTMAQALRLVSVRRGHDPRRVCLVPLGGAGAVHAGRLASALGVPTVVVPPAPGVLSALGLLLANIEHEQSRTLRGRVDRLDPAEVTATLTALDALCAERMADEDADSVEVTHFAELRYVKQSYELEVALPPGGVTPESLARAAEQFHVLHEQVYGFALPHRAVELVTLRAVHTAHLPELALDSGLTGAGRAEPTAVRPVYFEEIGGYEPTPIYLRSALAQDQEVVGPAIVEQPDTTTVIYPGQRLRVDRTGNLVITVAAGEPATVGREAIDVR
jgi:N-methylhydantoinase A